MVVACAAGVVVAALADAIVGEHGQQRRRHQPGVHLLDDLVAAHLDFHEMVQLPAKGGEQIVEAPEAGRRCRSRRPELLSGPRVHAIVQRQFQHLHQIEVAGEDVGLLAERARFDATAATAGSGVLQRLALAHLLLDHCIGIED